VAIIPPRRDDSLVENARATLRFQKWIEDISQQADGDFVVANPPIVSATHTKITYDEKGLVTAGEDATTTDIPEGNKLYYTDDRVNHFVGSYDGILNGNGSTIGTVTVGSGLTYAGGTLSADTPTLNAVLPITYNSGTISTSMNTSRLIGRTTASSGVMEEIAVGSNLTLSSGTLNTASTITASIIGNASTASTISGVTGPISITNNTSTITSQTGTGTIFVVDTAPTINYLTLGAGNSTLSPLIYTAGTILASPTAGATGYDGLAKYQCFNTIMGFQPEYIVSSYLVGSAITNISSSAPLFGSGKDINLLPSTWHEIKMKIYLIKDTANATADIVFTFAVTPTQVRFTWLGSVGTGATSGATFSPSTSNDEFGAHVSVSNPITCTTPTLTAGATHFIYIDMMVLTSATSGQNMKTTISTGTNTLSVRASTMWECRAIPPNEGTYA
jgi:hypothetical protein